MALIASEGTPYLVHCKRCARRLKSKVARERGYGPVCFAKSQAERERYERAKVSE